MMDLRKRNRFLGGFENLDYLGDYLAGQDEQFTPAVNIAENDQRYKIEMGLPGFNRDNFRIDVERDCLLVRGTAEKGDNYVKNEYTRQEFNVESFERSFRLPDNIDQNQISATFIDGLLEIELPKRKGAGQSGRKIKIS